MYPVWLILVFLYSYLAGMFLIIIWLLRGGWRYGCFQKKHSADWFRGEKIIARKLQTLIHAWFCPCFFRLVLPTFLFSLRDINLTLGLLPLRRHVVWRDSVGVESSGSGLKIRVCGYFASELSLLLRHTDESQKGRNSCLWLQSRSVLNSFGIVLIQILTDTLFI